MTNYSIVYPAEKTGGYGIKITEIRIIEDITNDFIVIKKLVDTCNRCEVEAEFFPDILENFLSDQESF